MASTLWAVRFDLAKLETLGDPVPVQEQLMTIGFGGPGNFSVSRHRTLVYAPRRPPFARVG